MKRTVKCMTALALSLTLGAALPAKAQPGPLIAELDALAAAKSWRELGTHLTAVPPTMRDDHWASLAEQAAVGDLAASSEDFDARLTAVERYLTTFPTLRRSQKFLALRASIGLGAFGNCIDQTRYSNSYLTACVRKFENFVRGISEDRELALSAARLVARTRKLSREVAATFFVAALEAAGDQTATVCNDSELADVVIAALDNPAQSPAAKAAVSLTGTCWEALNSAIVAEIAQRSDGSYVLRNACPTLLERNAVTGLRAARCREMMSR